MSVCGLYVSHVGEGGRGFRGENNQGRAREGGGGGGGAVVAGGESGRGGICTVCKNNDGGVRSPWIIVVNK